MKGRAPKSSVTGFHARVTRKPGPKRVRAGTACRYSTTMIASTTTGAARLTTVVTTRKRSGCRRVESRIGSARIKFLGEPVEAVTDAAQGDDRERRFAGELLAEPSDVHVERLALARELRAPHVIEEGVPALHTPGVGDQVRQQVDLASVQEDPARRAVHDEGPDGVNLRLRPGSLGVVLRAPEDRVHSRDDLAHGEGLGDV